MYATEKLIINIYVGKIKNTAVDSRALPSHRYRLIAPTCAAPKSRGISEPLINK